MADVPKAKLKCFVISPIGSLGSAERKRSDGILKEVIRAALDPLNFDVERADHDPSPGLITDGIIQKVYAADLCVAELTDLNPNVFYELSLRHASAKPVIQMMEHSGKLPFDLQDQNTVFYEATLDGRDSAIQGIRAAWNRLKDGAPGDNVIQRALRTGDLLEKLRSRRNEGSTVEGIVVAGLQRVLDRIGLLESRIPYALSQPSPTDQIEAFVAGHPLMNRFRLKHLHVVPTVNGYIAVLAFPFRELTIDVKNEGRPFEVIVDDIAMRAATLLVADMPGVTLDDILADRKRLIYDI